MKKFTSSFSIGLFCICLFSCESAEKELSRKEIVKNNIEGKLMGSINDPDSYEFVSLDLVDSISYLDNVNYRKDYFQDRVTREKERLSSIEHYKTSLPSMYDEKETIELKEEIQNNEKIIAGIDSISKNLGEEINQITSFTYIFKCRANNALGAKILNEFIVQTNSSPNYELLNITNEKDKVLLNPNEFPGYLDMVLNLK